MPRYDIFVAYDGNTLHEIIEADDEEAAKAEGRRLAAKEFRMDWALEQSIKMDDPEWFEGELDGFLVEERD